MVYTVQGPEWSVLNSSSELITDLSEYFGIYKLTEKLHIGIFSGPPLLGWNDYIYGGYSCVLSEMTL